MPPAEAADDRWYASARYAGLAATTLMAALSWWVGALPWQRPGQLSPAAPVLHGPTWHGIGLGLWVVAAAVLVAAWSVIGRGVLRGRMPPRAVLATAALWATPLLLAAPLASHDVYSYACQGEAYVADADPYRVGPASLPCRWLAAVSPIWRAQPTPYGPLAVLISGAAVAEHGPMLVTVAALRLAAVAGLALLAFCLPRLAARCGGDPAVALWLGLASPVVLIHLVGGAHHDALLAGLIVAGLTVAAGGRTIRAGVLLGLAVAVKATAVVAVPFAILLAIAAERRQTTTAAERRQTTTAAERRQTTTALRAAIAVGLSVVGAFAAVTIAAGLDLGWLRSLPLAHQPVSWMSPPSAVGAVVGAVVVGVLSLFGVPATVAGAVEIARAVALYALLPATLVVVWWRAARAGTINAAVQGAGAALAATVVLAPVVYPWYVTTPIAVMAAAATSRRVRRVAAVLIAVLTFVVLPDSLNVAIVTRWPGIVVEVIALVWVSVWLVRRRRPGRPVVPDDRAPRRAPLSSPPPASD